MAESRETWPLRRGFDRYYGFLGEATSQWDPDLIYDNQHVDPPYLPADGYHLSADLVGMAVEFIRDGAQTAPGQPWLCYLSFGATGIPQSAPREWAEMYRGRFDAGYDHYREIVLENMRRLGLVPDSTELTPAERRLVRGQAARAVRPWHSLSDDQKQLSSRLAESSAGLCSYTDHQAGRLLRYLEESGQLADTIVVACSANAAGASGGPGGPPGGSELFASGPGDAADGSWHRDLTGAAGRSLCSAGWERAFRMPYNKLGQPALADSVASPLIISSAPDMRDVAGGVRDQYHHAVDIVPTILDCAGVDRPQVIKGNAQPALHGVSMRYSFTAPDEPSVWLTQRCDMPGGQATCHDDGKAVAGRRVSRDGSNGAAGARELYHVGAGRAEADEGTEANDLAGVDEGAEVDDLAARYPQEAAELASLWAAAAPGPGGEAQDDRVAG